MSGANYLCTTDDECPRHGKFIYYCPQCHEEWAQDNPNVSALLRRGVTDKSSLLAARKRDKAQRAEIIPQGGGDQ